MLRFCVVLALALLFHPALASNKGLQNEHPPRAERSEKTYNYQPITNQSDYSVPHFVFVPLPYAYPYPENDARQSAQEADKNWEYAMLKKLTDDPLVLLTLVIALANIALAIFAGLGIRDTGIAARAAEKSAMAAVINADATRTQLRAYLSVLPVGIELAKDGHTVRVHLTKKNVGLTPAFDAHVLWQITVHEYPMKVPFEFVEDKKVPATPVIYPGGDHTPSRPKTLTEQELADLLNPESKMALFVAGRVKYDDAFKRDQVAEFCCFITPKEFTAWYALASKRFEFPFKVPFRFGEFNNLST